MKWKPKSVNVLGKVYQIRYFDQPWKVDFTGREPMFGQIDPYKRTIRLMSNGSVEDLRHTLIHEILHAICLELKLEFFIDEENHNTLDLIALALSDTLSRNGWLRK